MCPIPIMHKIVMTASRGDPEWPWLLFFIMMLTTISSLVTGVSSRRVGGGGINIIVREILRESHYILGVGEFKGGTRAHNNQMSKLNWLFGMI